MKDTFLHEKIYRGESFFKRIAEQSILVCGCGAIGSNLLDNMVRQGFTKVSVIDFDRIEDHNRNTQLWGKRDSGQPKVKMIKNKIYMDMGVDVVPYDLRLTDETISKVFKDHKRSIVVDGFDNTESRKLVTEYCKLQSIECLHVGLSSDYAEVIWNERYRVPKASGEDVCEYPMARNIILLAVAVATEVIIRFIAEGIKENYTITLGDFKISLM